MIDARTAAATIAPGGPGAPARDLDLRGLAAQLHRSYDWTQRNWRTFRHERTGELLPRPFIGGARGSHPWWRAADIDAWKAGLAVETAAHADACRAQPGADAAAANDPVPRRIAPSDAAAELLAAAGG